jgi:hypothetical protein
MRQFDVEISYHRIYCSREMRYEKYEGTEYNAEMNMKKTKLKNANRR